MKRLFTILAVVFLSNIIKAQAIKSIEPNRVRTGSTSDLIINTSKTTFTSPALVQFSGEFPPTVNSTVVVNDSTLKINVTVPVESGYESFLSLRIGSQFINRGNNILYIDDVLSAPHFVNISPSEAWAGDTVTVTVTTANTGFKSGDNLTFMMRLPDFSEVLNGTDTHMINDSAFVSTIVLPLNPNEYYLNEIHLFWNSHAIRSYGRFLVKKRFPVGLSERLVSQDFKIYPAPVRHELNIEAIGNISNVQLMNSLGQAVVIYPQHIINNNHKCIVQLDSYSFTSGVYYLLFVSENGTFCRKIMLDSGK